MRKMFLTLALLFITTFGFAQTVQWYQATSFASKPYKKQFMNVEILYMYKEAVSDD